MTLSLSEDSRVAHDFAIKWFEIHAAQRIKMINFFIVISAAFIAGYFAVFDGQHKVSATLLSAIFGFLTLCFAQIDRRTCELVKIGEDYLRISLDLYEKKLGDPAINLIRMADRQDGALSYSQIFKLIFSVAFLASIVAGTASWVSLK